MLGLHFALPLRTLLTWPYTVNGWILFVLGLLVAIFVNRQFARYETTIKPFEESTTLITDGLFAISRNPIYLASVIGLIGFWLGLGTVSPVIVIPIYVWLITTRFIVVEEAMLEARFGDTYREYMVSTRRWL